MGRPNDWSLRQSTKSNSKLASLEHEQTTAELASLLTRAFERMVEQFFDCFTDGLELKLYMFCSLAWPEMDMMCREGTLAFARLLVYHIKGCTKKTFKVLPSRKYIGLPVVIKEQASRRTGNRLESLPHIE